ncbi:ABC transporter substrate-binding protein [Streptomyces tanashiensis]|uniref:ABC transporter substrate-binding protein n=1 Tax=Streptomyces tanashiensis TaxID=67367 RepID=UPI0036E73901
MSGAQAWGFTDDRGTEAAAEGVPLRVVAYVRAGAALCDLGVKPVAVYGSGHDGAALDPAKAGGLRAAGVPYLGPGRALDEEALRELRPDVIVDVTYDGKSPYALDEAVAERLGVPLAALSVGNELTLPAILDRFAALAASLGAEPVRAASDAELAAAEAGLRDVAARSALAVLALSGAGPEQVHLARPQAWPELAHLAELGVRLVDPGPGPGANWLTGDWAGAAGLRPDLVLFDDREHATPPYELPSGVRLTPWNPETPPSPAAYARFFRDLAEALAA